MARKQPKKNQKRNCPKSLSPLVKIKWSVHYITFSEYCYMIKTKTLKRRRRARNWQRHYIIQKLDFLSFQGSTAPFAIQQGSFLFVPCDRILQRAHWLWRILIYWTKRSILTASKSKGTILSIDWKVTQVHITGGYQVSAVEGELRKFPKSGLKSENVCRALSTDPTDFRWARGGR